MKARLRRLLIPLLALAVLAALLWYGDAPRVVATAGRLRLTYLPWFLFVLVAHEVARGILWLLLLRALSLQAPLRTEVVAFAAGEVTKALPAGAYLQNYLLQRAAGGSVGRTSAATTLMILAEIAAALLGVVALGLGAWSNWLRPAAVVVVVATLLGVLLGATRARARLPGWLRGHRGLARALEEIGRFRAGAAALLRPPVLAITLLLCAGYVLLAGVDLYLVIRALGIGGVSVRQAIAVNCFGLAFYLVLGSVEAAGVVALIGSGVSKTAAVSAILVNRALSVSATVALAGLVLAILRDAWRSARQPPERQEGRAPPAKNEPADTAPEGD